MCEINITVGYINSDGFLKLYFHRIAFSLFQLHALGGGDFRIVGHGPSAYCQRIEMHCNGPGPCKRNHAYGCTQGRVRTECRRIIRVGGYHIGRRTDLPRCGISPLLYVYTRAIADRIAWKSGRTDGNRQFT